MSHDCVTFCRIPFVRRRRRARTCATAPWSPAPKQGGRRRRTGAAPRASAGPTPAWMGRLGGRRWTQLGRPAPAPTLIWWWVKEPSQLSNRRATPTPSTLVTGTISALFHFFQGGPRSSNFWNDENKCILNKRTIKVCVSCSSPCFGASALDVANT